jgi:NAD-dependent dihydropyrimidine dehydrogenase PreA subunit
MGGDLHLTEYALECVQTIPVKLTPNSVLVKCTRLHPNNDYEPSISSGPTEESMCFGLGLCYTIVSEKEAIKQNKDATPCVANKPLAHPARPK